MTAQEMVRRYVHAVTRRLPASRRGDIGMELASLLEEEIGGRVAAGATEAEAASAAITRMGQPDAVAMNYLQTAPVIEARDTRVFMKAMAIGFGALCVLAVSVVISDPRATVEPDFSQRVTDDAVSTVLQYLGVLTLVFWGVGIWRRNARKRAWSPASLPSVPDTEAVNRPLAVLSLLFWSAGLGVLVAGPANVFTALSGGAAPAALLEAFAYDVDFLASRATVLWTALAVSIAIAGWPVIAGRRATAWRRAESTATILLSLLIYAVLLAGDVFAQEPTNGIMKLAMAIFAGWGLIEGVSSWMRERRTDVRAAASRAG